METAFGLLRESADTASNAVAAVAGLGAKLVQQSGGSVSSFEARRLQASLVVEVRPLAHAAAKALTLVASMRGRIDEAMDAVDAAIRQRNTALEVCTREQKVLRDQATAMHEQRLALMEELSESNTARTALAKQVAELRAAHEASESQHVREVKELKATLASFQNSDRLVERVQRARAANSVRRMSAPVLEATPAHKAPVSPSSCAIEPVADRLSPSSGSSSDDSDSAISVQQNGASTRIPRHSVTRGRRWADNLLASKALDHSFGGPSASEIGATSTAVSLNVTTVSEAEMRQELAAKNNALRSMGKQLLSLRDKLAHEEAESKSLREQLERARSETVHALSNVRKLHQELEEAHAVADAVSGVARLEGECLQRRALDGLTCGASTRGDTKSNLTTPRRTAALLAGTSSVGRRLAELERSLSSRVREVHAASAKEQRQPPHMQDRIGAACPLRQLGRKRRASALLPWPRQLVWTRSSGLRSRL